MASGPYTRFYWQFIEEYPAIFDDKPTLGWWLTLLVIADGAFPSPAHMPAGVPPKVRGKLIAAELLSVDGSRYRIRGVDAERTRRREAARVGGLVRGRSANAEQTLSERLPNGEPSRAEKKKETSITRDALFEEAEAAVARGEYLTYAAAIEGMRATHEH